MLQQFINKHYFELFVFTLILGLLLYGTIGFDGIDEICAFLLFIFMLFGVFHTKDWRFNKPFLVTIGIFLFYTIYSILINSNVKRAIIKDLIIEFKPYLAFFATYLLYPSFSDRQKSILRIICMAFWLMLLGLGFMTLHDKFIINTVMFHNSYYAACVIALSLIVLFCGKDTTKDKLLFIIMLAAGLFSTRSKFYGFFLLSTILILIAPKLKDFKINIKTILFGIVTIGLLVLVGWNKLDLYFAIGGTEEDIQSGLVARMMLYKTSLDVLVDYFPFGPGFASFASFASGVYYSDLYYKYGLDGIWGINKIDYSYIADTYYPCLTQFGIIGIFLFFYFFWYLVKKSYSLYKQNLQEKYLVITLLVIGFFLIESIADATFTSHRGFFLMMLLGVVIAEQKQVTDKIVQK